MASEAEILARKKDMSDKISTQVRTLGVGILALTWGLAVSDSAIAKEITVRLRMPLLWVGTLAIGVILLDFLQYVCSYEVARRLINYMEANKLTDGEYDYSSVLYRLQSVLFYGKQILLAAGAFYLIYELIRFILGLG
jgi:hypothetical protein